MVTRDLNHMHHALTHALRDHWRLFAFQGVIMVILGLCAIVAPAVATPIVALFVGWLFLLSGIVGLIATFSSKDMPAFLWSLLTSGWGILVIALAGRRFVHDADMALAAAVPR